MELKVTKQNSRKMGAKLLEPKLELPGSDECEYLVQKNVIDNQYFASTKLPSPLFRFTLFVASLSQIQFIITMNPVF